ncbi:hypothetical protein VT52_020090 [Streptomyces malaysiense]|uniref:Secreted protein n=1 Tax=Streptomyces malaysiense TaxID=1428626 RepID=A0A1J4PXX6_9ACTN|nr:hypothetical protein VT52_020090 [Streptomyces malaysiense]
MGKRIGVGALAVLVVAGIASTAVIVAEAGRDPGAPGWRIPPAAAAGGTGPDTSGLGGMLLPYTWGAGGYGRGPDIEEYGSDVELSGRQATALRKQAVADWPADTRRKLDDLIDKQHVSGMAMRSYASIDSWSVNGRHSFTVTFQLMRMGNRDSVRAMDASQKALFSVLDVFRKGPAIKGHKEAACFLTPKNDGEKLDRMFCSAAEGDVLVDVQVSGHRPLDGNAVALFAGRELDRVKDKDPGEAV